MCRSDRSAVDALLEVALDVGEIDASTPQRALTVAAEVLMDALSLGASEGAEAVAERLAEVGDYVAALADARRIVRVEVRGTDDDGDELALVSSARHGLWLEHDATPDQGVVELERTSVDGARDRLVALVSAIG